MVKPRYKRFLEELPLNGNKIKPSAIKAGYSEIYADKQGKILLNNAIKQSAKEIIASVSKNELTTEEAKTKAYELLGYSREEVYKRLKHIADNEKDYSSALKVLSVIASDLGIQLNPDNQTNISVPVLNIVVDKPNNEAIQGVIEGERG